jgi:hypothetical protein
VAGKTDGQLRAEHLGQPTGRVVDSRLRLVPGPTRLSRQIGEVIRPGTTRFFAIGMPRPSPCTTLHGNIPSEIRAVMMLRTRLQSADARPSRIGPRNAQGEYHVAQLPFVVPLLMAALFFLGAVISAIRFVNSGANVSTVMGLAINTTLTLVFAWLAWVAWSGPSFP